jgi:aspartate aminotransferase
MMHIAERISRLGTETAFEVLVRARALEAQGKSIVHLEIGEPDFDTPQNIIDAAKKALDDGFTHYGPSAGLPEARQAVADYIKRTRGTEYTPNEIVITPGAKPILFYGMMAVIDKGDEVIYPNPGFPIYHTQNQNGDYQYTSKSNRWNSHKRRFATHSRTCRTA